MSAQPAERLPALVPPSLPNDSLSMWRAQTNEHLAQIIQTATLVPSEFRDIYHFTVMNPDAKRLRPALAYAIGTALDIEPADLHDLAAGTELAHTATIIMDDLPAQDDESSRRGEDSAHRKFGAGVIEVTSLHMALRAVRVVSATDTRLHLNGELTDFANDQVSELCPGQIRDLGTFQGPSPREITDVKELDEVSASKTSPLMKLPTMGAVLIARRPSPDSEHLTALLAQYSRHFGIGYQIKDDINDIEEDKANGNKSTYVSVLNGIENAQSWLEHHTALADLALEQLSAEIDTAPLQEVTAYLDIRHPQSHIADPRHHR